MRQLRIAVISSVTILLLLCAWISSGKFVNGQTQPLLTDVRLSKKLVQRKQVLSRQELLRNQSLDKLEFLRRFPVPKPPFPFPELCFIPPLTLSKAIDPHRSLFVHDRPTLDAKDFSLKRTLDQMAGQVLSLVPGTTAVSIFRQFWDTQNSPPGILSSSPHCTGTLNGFSINCPRNEGSEAAGTDVQINNRMVEYKPIALVNRLDLAHQGWRNCGEYRIVYGKLAGVRKNFIIFEAVLPNPKPGCREGCVPIAEFWRDLSTVNDPVERAKRLEEFYYKGLPGYRPVVHVDHYSATGVTSSYGSSGSGQIRTNQFLQTPWMLKEFKTVIDCGASPCMFAIVPTMVRVNPHGTLWNQDNSDPRAADFQADTLLQISSLSSGSLMDIGYAVDLNNDAGQSMSQPGPGFIDDFRDQMNAATAFSFRTGLATGGLTADQMANRALTQSCAGCHQPSTFGLELPDSIGMVLTPAGSPMSSIDRWPNSITAGFAHVDVRTTVRPELAANPAAFGTGQGQEISQALLDFFLPDRKNFLIKQLNAARCNCVHRFRFLSVAKRRLALNIQGRVREQFKARLTVLDQRALELQGVNNIGEEYFSIARERAALVAERDRVTVTELRRNGIILPDDELLELNPQFNKLKAASAAKGSAVLENRLRIAEVNQMLQREPPRRTVTGSFRVH